MLGTFTPVARGSTESAGRRSTIIDSIPNLASNRLKVSPARPAPMIKTGTASGDAGTSPTSLD
jgi:hypothetical protein